MDEIVDWAREEAVEKQVINRKLKKVITPHGKC